MSEIRIGVQGTLLVVAPFAPDFDRFAGSLRFFTMLRILSRHYRILFLGEVTPGGQRYVDALCALGVEFHPRSSTSIALLLRQVDVGVFFEFYHTAEDVLELVRMARSDLPIIVDSVDLHFVREGRAVTYAAGSEVAKRQAAETQRRELDVYGAADAVIVVTDTDRRILFEHLPNCRIGVVPTIHHEAGEIPNFQDRKAESLLFVGGFAHAPNVDAVVFFCREVLPLIRGSVPGITVTIVGDRPPEEVRAFASDHVTVTGWVPDVVPYLDSHLVSIAPLRFGSGMKGKVGEALARGLPVVVTEIAAEGMDLIDGETALIANTAEDFARAVVRLLGDRALHQRLSTNGRRLVRTRWSEEVVGEQLLGLMKTLAEVSPKRATALVRGRWMARDVLRAFGVGRLLTRLRAILGSG